MLGHDHARGGHDHGPLDDVLQLAHVARPVVADEAIHGVGGHPPLAQGLGVLGQEVLGEQRDVTAAIPEGGQRERDDIQAVEQVFPELPRLHHGLEVAVGGREHAHVHADQLVPADPLEGPLLQGAQQLHLQLGRHVADLVEEYRAAVGQLELAEAALLGVGERALLVAEQLGLEQGDGNGRRRDAHERPPRAAAVVVQRARHHFLAGAGLAAQQHADVGGRDAADGLVDLLHRRVPAHQRAELPDLLEAGAERGHLLGEAARGEGPLRQQQRLVEIEGLGQVVVGAVLHGGNRRLHRAVGGHDHDLRVRPAGAHLLEQRQAVDAGHADIEEDQVERPALDLPEGRGAVLDRGDLVARAAEALLEDPAQAVLVVGDQDAASIHSQSVVVEDIAQRGGLFAPLALIGCARSSRLWIEASCTGRPGLIGRGGGSRRPRCRGRAR